MNRLILAFVLALPTAQTQSTIPVAAEVVRELNQLRADPSAYAVKLRNLRSRFQGNQIRIDGQTSLLTQEGVRAVDEAIGALEKAPRSENPLISQTGLTHAAADHAHDTGSRGITGHVGSDGSDPSSRAGRYGKWTGTIGENVAFGPASAEEVITQLLIDDGISDRGHRRSLLDPRWRFVGIACADHARFRAVCVLDLATGYVSR